MNQYADVFVQVSRNTPWPSGYYIEIALLPISEEVVATVLGFPLTEGTENGLGVWVASGIRLRSGGIVEVINYRDRPGPKGFILRIDSTLPLTSTLDEVLHIFGLSCAELPWIYPSTQA